MKTQLFKKVGFLFALIISSLANHAQAERTVTYMHSDALGSVIAASDENGEVLWRKQYQPFGTQVEGSDKTEDVSYTGKKFNQTTGLNYYGARHYDPFSGRFVSVDPVGALGAAAGNTMMFNRYGYANNNPYLFVDPDGRQAISNNEAWATMLGESNPNHLAPPAAEIGENLAAGADIVGEIADPDATTLIPGAVLFKAVKATKATKGLTKFDDATTLAASRLGFDPTDVVVKNGVADIPIIFTSKVSPRDITAVTNALKGQGVQSVRINTGPIINSGITSRLENAADTGRSIFGGFRARRTNNPENPFVLERGL